MRETLQSAASRFTTIHWVVVCLLLLTVIALSDHATGYEISFSIFYLAPVGIAAWHLNRSLANLTCVLSALIWLSVDFAAGSAYSHLAIPFWNAAVRLGFFITVATLIARIRRLLSDLALLAQRDGLTGLLNSRAFFEQCDFTFELAHRHDHTVALGYIDIDGFKAINDTLGHAAGDEVLKGVADTLTGRLRKTDVCARLGGDEFALLLPETGLSGARSFCTDLHHALVSLARDRQWPIGFSMGVAVFIAPQTRPDDAIKQADELMYQVKHSGKNSIRFAEFGKL
ncbi:MAG: GGDEF domain-containing protein [Halioglobus sp.]|nr:GGDEF domain-containing protein [Halioglobus sp.]